MVMALVLAVMGPAAGAASDQASFAAAESYAAGKVPYDVTSADFDGDGNLDLAGASFPPATTPPMLQTTIPKA